MPWPGLCPQGGQEGDGDSAGRCRRDPTQAPRCPGRAPQRRFSPTSLVTKKKKELCADPQAPWAQAHLKHFQSLKN